jgi:hypothetical protein
MKGSELSRDKNVKPNVFGSLAGRNAMRGKSKDYFMNLFA